MKSCIYEGQVSHTRVQPVRHRFDYRIFMMYVDLDELPQLFEKHWFWSASSAALATFKRDRHMGEGDLQEDVRDLVAEKLGARPTGPIRLLTNFSYFGFWFSPVSFYYCFADDGETVEAVVVEVNNTPWGEQHCYVESCTNAQGKPNLWRFSVSKEMHVSPFMPMDVNYKWVLTQPSAAVSVFMANEISGSRAFKAMLNLERREITSYSLAGVLYRYPFQTMRTILAIHWQALRLWLKRVPIHPHPEKSASMVEQR